MKIKNKYLRNRLRKVKSFKRMMKSHINLTEKMHAPANFRRILNRKRKSKEKMALSKIKQGDCDTEFPVFKRNADWLYF